MAWMLSSDSHVVEPPDLWAGHGGSLAGRMPRVEHLDDGDWWIVDGYKTMSFLGIQTGDRFAGEPDKLRTSGTFDEVRAAAYDPRRYVEENEGDGIWGSVLYPSQGLVLYEVPVTDVVTASMRRYNDWLADFCSEAPARLKGIAMLNVDDIDAAVAELARCRERGLVGALITVAPPPWQPYRSPAYDPLWAAAQDLAMPLALHVGTDRADPRVGRPAFRLDVKNVPPSVFVNPDAQVRRAFAEIIFSRVFERFPRLRIGSVEHELGWIPFFLDRLDYAYTDRPPRGPEWQRFADPGMLPSDFFRRNAFASFQEDPHALRLLDALGPGVPTWGSDYPHTESTFPRSRDIVATLVKDLDDADVARITCTTCAELYGFDVP
ncbi:MAG TPA: amidohydrolase family protein [Acidimicrobiales bacterium]|nr:amidohydrolase family protein [Acidimicrobiales bacterium]